MSSYVTMTKEEKIKNMTEILKELNPNFNVVMPEDDIIEFLDQKVGNTFDKNVLEQLLEKINQDHYGQFTIQNFIDIWIKADDILTQKIKKNSQKIKDSQENQEYYKRKIEKSIQKQILNKNGIMEGSFLKINFDQICIQNQHFHLELTMGDQKFQTADLDSKTNQISEQFKFKITTGKEELIVSIIVDNEEKSSTKINLQNLNDQKDHKDQENFNRNDYVIITKQWIFNKVKLYKDFLQEKVNEDKQNFETLEQAKSDQRVLYQPFPQFNKNQPSNKSQSIKQDIKQQLNSNLQQVQNHTSKINQERYNVDHAQNSTNNLENPINFSHQQPNIAKNLDHSINNQQIIHNIEHKKNSQDQTSYINNQQKQIGDTQNNHILGNHSTQFQASKKYFVAKHKLFEMDIYFFSRIMILIILLLSIFESFSRSTNISILICAYYLNLWIDNQFDEKRIYRLMGMIFITIIIDISWLSIYKDVFSVGEQDDSIKGFVWVMCMFSVIAKFIAEISLFILNKKLENYNKIIPI